MSKRLIIRLSSLGDVVLSTSALCAMTQKTDILTKSEYSFVFDNHPNLGKVLSFEKKRGWKEWQRLIEVIKSEEYDVIYDLQGSLRTFWMQIRSLFWSKRPRWRRMPKERNAVENLLTFKKLLPARFHPTPVYRKMSNTVNRASDAVPKLFPSEKVPRDPSLIGLMPSSAWNTKEISTTQWMSLISKIRVENPSLRFVVFGTENDISSRMLIESLHEESIDTLEPPSESETMGYLQRIRLLIAVDTGLAHWAEALGTPVVAIYGPTTPELGFGIRLEESEAVRSGCWCQPCSKSGRICYRLDAPYTCLREIDSNMILEAFRKTWAKT